MHLLKVYGYLEGEMMWSSAESQGVFQDSR